MPFSVTLKLAFQALLSNKSRTFLSILGVVIGISSVIILMALGDGAQTYILDKVRSLGSNIVNIFPGTPEEEGFSAPASFSGIVITTLTYEDALALRDNPLAPNISDTTATVGSQVAVSSVFNEKLIQFYGTTPSYFSIRNTKIVVGRSFEERETESLSRVAVLGPKAKKDLFPNSDGIGEDIKINNYNFKVIGITEEKGQGQYGVDLDKIVYIPITTAQKLILGINYVNTISAVADSENTTELAADQAKNILRNRHSIKENEKPDFIINDTKEALSIVNNITNAFSLFLAAIASISLLVGGIGIMNIMLVSVTERTKEIGLRKSIGAKKNDILWQFVAEAVFITLLGGIIGIAAGASITFAISALTPLKASVSPLSIILAIGVSTIFGLVFGIYPANQAAKLNPIEALRFQ